MATTYTIQKFPDSNTPLSNTLFHNPTDFNNKHSIYLKINGTYLYPSTSNDTTTKGSICISAPIRNKLNLLPNEQITLTECQPSQHSITYININISRYNTKNNNTILTLHEDELKEIILNTFKSYYFYSVQYLLLQIKNINYIIQTITHQDGYITNNTTLNIISNDVLVSLVSSKLLKRDLFRDSYSFEELGIGGLDNELIGVFRRALSTRALNPAIIQKMGINHVKGLLLHGYPGTGKTLIARKIGSMISNIEPKIINGPEVMNKYVGQSEENIRNLFNDARKDYDKNKENASLHVIIFDEIDAICKKRGSGKSSSDVDDKIVNQLLSMIDGVNQLNNIFIIAMTNRKDMIDDALLRAGRLEIHIEIGLPDLNGRKQIFRIHTSKMQYNNMISKNVSIDKLASLTHNYSGAEIETVIKNAGSMALHEQLITDKKDIVESDIVVTMAHMLKSVKEIIPAFGNVDNVIESILPSKYLTLTKDHEKCYDGICDFIKKSKRLKTVLIGGESGVGKTALVSKIISEQGMRHVKIIRAIDMVAFDDFEKSNHIINIVKGAYSLDDSIIVIDDIEIAINYVKFGPSITFSNKVYQVLMTLLKTEPKKNNKLMLLVTCGNMDLFGSVCKSFDMLFEIGKMEVDDVKRVGNELGIGEIDYRLSIKELLSYV